MLSDTMGSTDTDSTDQLHKMLIDKDRMLFAVCSDRIERCSDLWPVIQKEVDKLKIRTHGNYLEALNKAVLGHRTQHFKYDVLYSRYAMDEQTMLATPEKIQEEWAVYDSQAAMIVGAFDQHGQALQYIIMNPNHRGGSGSWVEPTMFPGNAAIGVGAYNADFWLNYRCQNLGFSIRQSIYHAYEASKMASKAPTVNEECEIMVATKDTVTHHSTTFPVPPLDFPLSLATLAALFKERGPQNTEDLAIFA